jgi:hypothetical protein
MKNHKFQQIRVRFTKPGDIVRFNAQTDKQYSRIRGIYVSVPEERFVPGCLLGLKVNNQDVFEDVHEVKLLTSGNQVAPNQKFFYFEEHLDAAGSTVEGRLTDGQAPVSAPPSGENDYSAYGYPFEVKIYLWLNNEK